MWAISITLALLLQLSPPAHVRIIRADVVSVASIDTLVHRRGQTFITGTRNAGATSGTIITIRRSSSPITSASDGTQVASLDADSYRLKYNDNAILNGENLTAGLVLEDVGTPKNSTQFAAVITTPVSGTGNAYYRAFTSDDPSPVSSGLTGPIAETYQGVPGAILLGTTVVGSRTVRRYFAWEDITTWPARGYYGFRFNVSYVTGSGGSRPLYLHLHGAPQGGYAEPVLGFNGDAFGVEITPVDNDFSGGGDPYTAAWSATSWLGYYDAGADKWKTQGGVARLLRIVKMVRDNAVGDGFDFQVNANRVYVWGASMGSMSMHLLRHYPDVFTAGGVGIGFVDNSHAHFPNGTKLVDDTGLTLNQFLDLPTYATQQRLPPTVHQFSADDHTLSPDHYDELIAALETGHQPYYVEWMNTDHLSQDVTPTQWKPAVGTGLLRFRRNEAYPAFGTASTSSAAPSFPVQQAGNRNGTLDWQDTDHTISGGSPITDTATAFGISVNSSSAATGVTTTICNAQNFRPSVGAVVTWSTNDGQSGTATVNADGTVTLDAGLNISTSAVRLTLVTSAPRVAWLRAG